MPLEVCICYAHEDELLRKNLEKQLVALKRQNYIDIWYDRNISAGTNWENEIDNHLNAARIILLLVSPNFMASDYCYSKEMKLTLERHEQGEAVVLPIILKPVYWKNTPFGKLQALPKDAKPITSWRNRNDALFNVVEGILKVIHEINSKSIMEEAIAEKEIDSDKDDWAIITGLRELDYLTGGFHPSELVIVGAPPATGKTSFALTIALNASINKATVVGVFSLEMNKEQFIQRLLAIDANINRQRLRTGWLEDEEWERIVDAMEKITKSDIIVFDSPRVTMNELRKQAHRMVDEYKVTFIIIDYVDLLEKEAHKLANREQEAADISRSLKVLARELDIPILAVAHKPRLSRYSFDRRQEEPMDNNADLVLYLHRDDLHNPNAERKNILDIIITKNRNGPLGEVSTYFSPYSGRVRDLEILPPTDQK